MIDTHCHIDMYPNPMDIVNESERLGIITIGMTNLPSHFIMGYPHLRSSKKTRLALGMHPLMAEKHYEELPLFYECIDKTSYIGEVGLDFSRNGFNTKEIQIDTFKKILEIVGNKPKILSIHSRKAENKVLQLLKDYKIKNAIFHWYSGEVKLIDHIVNKGYYFSINTAMINSKSGRRIIEEIPKEYILTESDGPYINLGSQLVKPKDVGLVINYLSKLFDIEYEIMENNIEQNFNRLINRIKY